MSEAEEQWYAVFDGNDKLISTGTVLDKTDLVAKGYRWHKLAENPTGKHWDGRQFREVAPPYPGLSIHEFKSRFTAAERQALLHAAANRTFAHDLVVHDFLDMLHTMAAENLRLYPDSAFVQEFLAHAILKGYLTAERAANIGAR